MNNYEIILAEITNNSDLLKQQFSNFNVIFPVNGQVEIDTQTKNLLKLQPDEIICLIITNYQSSENFFTKGKAQILIFALTSKRIISVDNLYAKPALLNFFSFDDKILQEKYENFNWDKIENLDLHETKIKINTNDLIQNDIFIGKEQVVFEMLKSLLYNLNFGVFQNLEKNQNWDTIIKLATEYQTKSKVVNPHIYYYKALSFSKLNQLSEAYKQNEICKKVFYDKYGNYTEPSNWSDNIKHLYYKISLLDSEILEKNSKTFDALWKYNECFIIATSEDERFDLKAKREVLYNQVISNFGDIEYTKRKVLYFDENISTLKTPTILPLKIESSKHLKFPPNHPKKQSLYVGHPYRSNVYYPVEQVEELLFETRVNEFIKILTRLGAKKIDIEHSKGSNFELFNKILTTEEIEKNVNVKAKVDVPIYGVPTTSKVDVKVKNETDNTFKNDTNTQNSNNQKVKYSIILQPKGKPEVPIDVIWFHHEEKWQLIASERKNGKMLNYKYHLSTSSSEVLTENEINTLKNEVNVLVDASFKYAKIFGADVNVNVKNKSELHSEISQTLKKKETIEWFFDIEFAPMEELIDENEKIFSISDNEQIYINDLNIVLADLIIDKDERNILEQRRKSLNISFERATELEEYVKSKYILSNPEQQFENIITTVFVDKKISETERNYIEQQRKQFGITKERAEEIEIKITNAKNKKSFIAELIEKIKNLF
jgi:hypothetical protein